MWTSVGKRLKSLVGIDNAIGFAVLTRACQMLASSGTVLLIVRFLTPTEQGYYYTLWSFVSLQTIFELGFSFVILQLAAHESGQLSISPEGNVTGNARSFERLASILQRSVRWYVAAGALMFLILLPAGIWFFSRNQAVGHIPGWHWPWVSVLVFSVFMFQIDPVFSFLEGCGYVSQTSKMRFAQTMVGISLSWMAMVSHHALFAPAMVILGKAIAGSAFLIRRRKLLLTLLRHTVTEHAVRWRTEVWGFQWRMALSWLSCYLTGQFLTPILFAYCGPAEAGKIGLSMSIVDQMSCIALVWMSTKSAPFGNLIARRNFVELDALFFRTLKQCLSLLVAGMVTFSLILPLLLHSIPELQSRLESVNIFCLLLLGALGNVIVQSEGFYVRAHKEDPLMKQAICVALVTLTSTVFFTKLWSGLGAGIAYFLCVGLINVASATAVFHSKRRSARIQPDRAFEVEHSYENGLSVI